MNESDYKGVSFTGPMVVATLGDLKTNTRRVVTGEALKWLDDSGFNPDFVADPDNQLSPYGYAGQILYVKEGYRIDGCGAITRDIPAGDGRQTFTVPVGDYLKGVYTADESEFSKTVTKTEFEKWSNRQFPNRPSPGRFMYKSLARIFLEVVSVRIERLQSISREDCQAEGHPPDWSRSEDIEVHLDAARDWFMDLWDSINGHRENCKWADNPWVWRVEFTKKEQRCG